MRFLADTNIFIYYATDQQMLSRDVFALLTDYDNLIYISIESLRELIVHYNNKALLRKFWPTKEQMLRDITEKYGFQILPLTPDVMYNIRKDKSLPQRPVRPCYHCSGYHNEDASYFRRYQVSSLS